MRAKYAAIRCADPRQCQTQSGIFAMIKKRSLLSLTLGIASLATLSACSAEPGSPEWCADMKDTPSQEWTPNEAQIYADTCLLDDIDRQLESQGF